MQNHSKLQIADNQAKLQGNFCILWRFPSWMGKEKITYRRFMATCWVLKFYGRSTCRYNFFWIGCQSLKAFEDERHKFNDNLIISDSRKLSDLFSLKCEKSLSFVKRKCIEIWFLNWSWLLNFKKGLALPTLCESS